MSPDEYLKTYADKIEFNYKTYKPKQEILRMINEFLINKGESLRIVALGADWCPDCSKNVPRMIKIVKALNSGSIEFKILYGIMVNALHKPNETIWHKTRSPPEAVDPKFDLKAIPTFYFFNKDNSYIGMIKENPQVGALEDDILYILENNL
jgi:hypothetical protein